MRASLDTNVIIHLYRAGIQSVLFDIFDEGVFIYEQIRNVELMRHGRDVLEEVDADIASGRIEIYSDQKLKEQAVYKIFENNVNENMNLYRTGNLIQVYAISLAQTFGEYSIVTDNTKQGGPYMSLLQFEDDIMPFTFADVLILRYLMGMSDENQTVKDFDAVNMASELNWAFRSQLSKFIRRFFKDPYREQDTIWIQKLQKDYGINLKSKLERLSKLI